MEGKILGIPLVLILLIVAIAAIILVPVVALHSADMVVSKEILKQESKTQAELSEVRKLLEVTPTVTPSVTVAPTKAVRSTGIKSSSSSAR